MCGDQAVQRERLLDMCDSNAPTLLREKAWATILRFQVWSRRSLVLKTPGIPETKAS